MILLSHRYGHFKINDPSKEDLKILGQLLHQFWDRLRFLNPNKVTMKCLIVFLKKFKLMNRHFKKIWLE
jgi:hypothetical protein